MSIYFDRKIGSVYDEAGAFIYRNPPQPPAQHQERQTTDSFEPVIVEEKKE